MELKKGQNLLQHGDEIYSRPARTWFQSEKEKQQAKGTLAVASETWKLNSVAASKQQYESGMSSKTPEKKQHVLEVSKVRRGFISPIELLVIPLSRSPNAINLPV